MQHRIPSNPFTMIKESSPHLIMSKINKETYYLACNGKGQLSHLTEMDLRNFPLHPNKQLCLTEVAAACCDNCYPKRVEEFVNDKLAKALSF